LRAVAAVVRNLAVAVARVATATHMARRQVEAVVPLKHRYQFLLASRLPLLSERAALEVVVVTFTETEQMEAILFLVP
jgi:hypothetical protein